MPLYKTLNKFSRKPDRMEMATSCLFTGIPLKLKETNTFIKHNRLNQLTIYKHDGGTDRFPLGSFSCSITDHVMILLGIPAFKFSNSRAQNL